MWVIIFILPLHIEQTAMCTAYRFYGTKQWVYTGACAGHTSLM